MLNVIFVRLPEPLALVVPNLVQAIFLTAPCMEVSGDMQKVDAPVLRKGSSAMLACDMFRMLWLYSISY
jgi:hypothetical protein